VVSLQGEGREALGARERPPGYGTLDVPKRGRCETADRIRRPGRLFAKEYRLPC
jgi:hypothetical protein